jgi:hypothetical protein
MRPAIILAVAAILTPAALAAHPASAPGFAAQSITDVSASKKKAKKPAKAKGENMKAAPSEPASSGKSTY